MNKDSFPEPKKNHPVVSFLSRNVFIYGIVLSSLLVLLVLLYRQREFILTYDWKIRWRFLIIPLFFYLLSLMLSVLVWSGVMDTLCEKIDFKYHYSYYCVSNVAKRLPGTLWYLPSRAAFYHRHNIFPVMTTLASGMELVVITLSGSLISLAAIQWLLDSPAAKMLVFGSMIVLLGISLYPPIQQTIFKWLKVHLSVKFTWKQIIWWVFLYSIVWCSGGMVLFYVANAVYPFDVGFIWKFIGSWSIAGIFASLLFLLPSTFGVVEVSLSLLLSRFMPSSLAVVVVVLTRVFLLVNDLIWVVPSLFIIRRNRMT